MIREHKAAVLALLADLPPPMTLYPDGEVPERPSFPYVVFHTTARNRRAVKVTNDSDEFRLQFQLTCVGLGDDAAGIVADAVAARLIDARPVVAGRTCKRIKLDVTLPIVTDSTYTDPDTGLHLSTARDSYLLESRPA
ncbi:tail completion protein gp17 [Prauserella muralis]|uniref:Uncharacterized protein n=1 Tax=Prauserella muralis TaxID=588067 RepID=A0A2V4AY75_9PSEU|nr:DUF3168 domain-containing protein [Prauserella muralis]PXY20880.1 hypothetical protein BAY60_25590 [Prauserella muralis]TWE29921.1 uncharacterized protein DUF3168 [Prauserella muralis]